MRTLCMGLIGAAWGLGSAASGQELTIQEALSVCAEVPDAVERVACFDELAKAAGVAPRAPKAPPVSIAEDDAAQPIQDSLEVDNAPRAVTTTDAEPSAPVATAESERKFIILADDDPRAEAVRNPPKPQRKKRYQATIAASKYSGYSTLMVKLDNGEVWKQIWPNRKLRLPKDGADVEIKRAPIGGWLMSINGATGIKVSLVSE